MTVGDYLKLEEKERRRKAKRKNADLWTELESLESRTNEITNRLLIIIAKALLRK